MYLSASLHLELRGSLPSGEEAVLEMVKFDLKDLAASSSSLNVPINDAEYLLELPLVLSLLIRALRDHSFRLNSGSFSCLLCE
ncbi:hypothetical protein Leryth_013710 [Lithospermum erythrorhizon]|nr:hypothetical protein Leryth_013710 [Lithospermum erythrorhizon]